MPADSSRGTIKAPLIVDEAEEIEDEFNEPNDPFYLEQDEDDAWGASIITRDDVEEANRARVPMRKRGELASLGGGWLSQAAGKVTSALKTAGRNISAATKEAGGKLAASTKEVGRQISEVSKQVGEDISKGAKEAGGQISESFKETFDPANFPWTQENREEGTRKAMDDALGPVWATLVNGDTENPSIMEIHRRIRSLLQAVVTQQETPYLAGPPTSVPGSAASDLVNQLQASASMGWIQYAIAAITSAGSLIEAGYIERAQGMLDDLNLAGSQTDIDAAIDAFRDAGGLLPAIGEVPPAEYMTGFYEQVKTDSASVPRVTGDSANNPKEGWYYHYIKALIQQLKDYKTPLQEARNAMLVALQAYQQEEMPKTLQAIGKIVSNLVKSRAISPTQVGDVVAVLHKVSQGYALTDDEQKLFSQVQPYITGSKVKKVAVGIGAAAVLTTLLSSF